MSIYDDVLGYNCLGPAPIKAQLKTMAGRRGSQEAQLVFLFMFIVLSSDLPNVRVSSYMEGQHATADSQHYVGTAIDLGVRTSVERAAADVVAGRWQGLGFPAIREVDHWHLQFWEAGELQQFPSFQTDDRGYYRSCGFNDFVGSIFG